MRRRFILLYGQHVARSSFWNRFNKNFGQLVKWFLEHLQEKSARTKAPLVGVLASFEDVIAVDATVIKVHKSLRARWPGTRRNSRPAAIKVYTWIRALTGELLKHRITAECFNDNKALGVTWNAAKKLFLFDMGFSSATVWWRIHRVGGFFLTRLPKSYWPKVISENRRHRGRARRLVRRDLREASWSLTRKIIDVNCVFRIHIRAYGKPRGHFEYPLFRVVGIRNEDKREYHFYVTNAPPKQLPAEAITDVYRLRWEVELHYRTGKGRLGLDDLKSTKAHIVETLVRASLIRCSIAMRAKLEAEKQLPIGLWINPEAWTEVWNDALPMIIVEIVTHGGLHLDWRALADLAADPNRKRIPNRVKHRPRNTVGGGLFP
jgi:hypothetical protein